jgi:hypothetical protein
VAWVILYLGVWVIVPHQGAELLGHKADIGDVALLNRAMEHWSDRFTLLPLLAGTLTLGREYIIDKH